MYETWEECRKQTDGFSKARFKSYHSQEIANQAYNERHDLKKQQARQARKTMELSSIEIMEIALDRLRTKIGR